LHKVSEIRDLRKKGLSEDEIAKRLTFVGAIYS
jgi:transcriptional regulator